MARKVLIIGGVATGTKAAARIKRLNPFLRKHRKKFKLEFLPAYSPELNPIERVWKLTRRLVPTMSTFLNSPIYRRQFHVS